MRFSMGDLPEKYRDQVEDKIDGKEKNENGEVKLIIPGELPTENEIIEKSKTHWAKYKKMKDKYEQLIEYYCQKQKIPFFEAIELDITYYRKDRRYDPDNIVAAKKFILDGLQEYGAIKNDGWKQVKGFRETWEVDKENPRVEIIIREV